MGDKPASGDAIKAAIKAKKINKPILKATTTGRKITLYLYGGEIVTWTLPAKKKASSAK